MGAGRPSTDDKSPLGAMSVGAGQDSKEGGGEACHVYVVELERQLQWMYNEPPTPQGGCSTQRPLVDSCSQPQCYDNLSITVAASMEHTAAVTGDISPAHTQQAPGGAGGTLHCFVEAKGPVASDAGHVHEATDCPLEVPYFVSDNDGSADRLQASPPGHSTAGVMQQAADELQSAAGREQPSAGPCASGAAPEQAVSAAERGSSEEGTSNSSQDTGFMPAAASRKQKRGHKKGGRKQRNGASEEQANLEWDASQPTLPRLNYTALKQPQLGKRKKDEVSNILMPSKKDKS